MKYLFKSVAFLTLFTLSFQFLGCGGADVQSAKLYRIQHDWRKANTMLEKALQSDPTNDEAWALYVQNLYDLNQYEKIADIIDTARLYSIKNRSMVELVRRNTWIQLYNGGLAAYNQNPDSKEQQQAAIDLLKSAMRVAPDQPETYELLGEVYYSAHDTTKYIATYEDALKQVRSNHDQGVAQGLRMRMEPSDVEKAIGGAPSKDTTVTVGNDSAKVYSYRSNDGYFYFEKAAKPPHKWELTGWRFTTTPEIGMVPMKVSITPYQRLANYYYEKGDKALDRKDKAKAEEYFDQAVPLFIAIQRLDPTDESAASFITEAYKKLNQPEKLKSEYERMLGEHPSKNLYTSYGTVLLGTGDYEGSIAAFKKALDIDPAYEFALYDLGAAYKNWAAELQKKVIPATIDPKTRKIITKATGDEQVREKLVTSTEYFEKVISVNKKEYGALDNLMQNYDILNPDKPEKGKSAFASLEALKTTDVAKDAAYWNLLGNIYLRQNRTKESEEAFKTADKLRGK